MFEIISAIADTSAPNFLIAAGIGFIALALVGRVTAHISLPANRTKPAAAFGVLLLLAGLVIVGVQAMPTLSSNTQAQGLRSGEWFVIAGSYSSSHLAELQAEDLRENGENFEVLWAPDYAILCGQYYAVVRRASSEREASSIARRVQDLVDPEGNNQVNPRSPNFDPARCN